jgi:hypothetical protein
MLEDRKIKTMARRHTASAVSGQKYLLQRADNALNCSNESYN